MVDICWSCVEECEGRQREQHPGLRLLHILSGWRSFLKNWWSVCPAAEVHRWECGRQGDRPPSCSTSKALLETARQSVICLHGKHRVAGNPPTRRTLITLAWQTIIWDSVTSVHTACPVSSLRQFRYPGEHWLFFFFNTRTVSTACGSWKENSHNHMHGYTHACVCAWMHTHNKIIHLNTFWIGWSQGSIDRTWFRFQDNTDTGDDMSGLEEAQGFDSILIVFSSFALVKKATMIYIEIVHLSLVTQTHIHVCIYVCV